MIASNRARIAALTSAVLIGGGLSLIGSCQAPGHAAAPAAAAGQPPPARAAVRVPDLSPGPGAVPTPRSRDGLWREASRGDPIDLERLANRESAAGLLRGFAEGHDVGLTALLALPHASDAELALGELCAVLGAMAGAPARAVLTSVHGIMARLPEPTEALDPHGRETCRPVLTRIAGAKTSAAAERDLASSALLLAREHAPR